MKRRHFLALVGVAASSPRAARSQSVHPARVGYLSGGSNDTGRILADCFRTGLRDLGCVEEKNIHIEYRWAGGILERYVPLAAELVGLNPDVIVATSTPGAQATKRATSQIPVVFIGISDPVASGIVSSVARPGANITGVSNFLPA